MENIIEELTDQGYTHLRVLDGKICGLHDYLFTMGLHVGLTEDSPGCRFCYENTQDAVAAIEAWDSKGFPSGPWIKAKGRLNDRWVDMLNPELK